MEERKKTERKLKQALGTSFQSFLNVPFPIIIKAITGYRVIPFNEQNSLDRELLASLKEAAQLAMNYAHKDQIESSRSNDVGDKMMPFVIKAIQDVGLHAGRSETSIKNWKTAGYPTILIRDRHDRITYLEAKSYGIKNESSSFRSFHLTAPLNPGDFKITCDARHLMISFEMKKIRPRFFVPVRWKLIRVENFVGDIKPEYQSTNKIMYNEKNVILEGARKEYY